MNQEILLSWMDVKIAKGEALQRLLKYELAQEELEILQNDIRQRLMAKDSVFTINLDEILQSHFNS